MNAEQIAWLLAVVAALLLPSSLIDAVFGQGALEGALSRASHVIAKLGEVASGMLNRQIEMVRIVRSRYPRFDSGAFVISVQVLLQLTFLGLDIWALVGLINSLGAGESIIAPVSMKVYLGIRAYFTANAVFGVRRTARRRGGKAALFDALLTLAILPVRSAVGVTWLVVATARQAFGPLPVGIVPRTLFVLGGAAALGSLIAQGIALFG